MKNRILYLTRNMIPYVKELHPIAGSVVGCILMQQLDYWFERHPDGFYKFLEPVDHDLYKAGESWTEELGVTKDEFRTAFDKIGIRYVSKGQYEGSMDKFSGKYYCSYFNKQTYCTRYFRNHVLLDAALDAMIFPDKKVAIKTRKAATADRKGRSTVDRESQSPVDRESRSPVDQVSQFPVDRECQSPVSRESQPPLYIVSEITLQRLKTTTGDGDDAVSDETKPGGCSVELIFPKAISDQEKIALTKILDGCNAAQQILDEIDGALANKSCRRNKIVPFGVSLHKAWAMGTFVPCLGIAVAKRRETERLHAEALARKTHDLDPAACQKGQALLDSIWKKKSSGPQSIQTSTQSSSPSACMLEKG